MTSVNYPEDFLKIWNTYPLKLGKYEGFKAFKKLKCHNGDTERIIKSILEHWETDAWQKDDGRFIPRLSTFLNQRRFEDFEDEA